MLNMHHRIDLSKWVENSKRDPVKYRRRQVTEILLSAIALIPYLHESLVLKGGILMNLVFQSPRNTSDIDFTTLADPAAYVQRIRQELDQGLQRAATKLGYVDLVCSVQKIEEQPSTFPDAKCPVLKISIGSAQRRTNEEKRLGEGQAPQTLRIDISFNEPIEYTKAIQLQSGGTVNAYSIVEVVAEKLRAFLQQKERNRARRQDIFDLAYLIENFPLDEEEQADVLRVLRIKAEVRDITPDVCSIADPEVIARARQNWQSMQDELDQPLPNFDERYAIVRAFYVGLPWRT